MVNHKKSLESKCIPQWRHQYIEYGELNELLSKAVKQVHKLFEAHACIIEAQKAKEQARREGSARLRNSNHHFHDKYDQHCESCPVIVLDELEKHQKFEKKVWM
jgi:hypothetical protein